MIEYTNAVKTHQLARTFGHFSAVQGVDFYIPKGEIFGLLGPNGAGKTTIIRMLCGILKPSGGSATVLGYDVSRDPEQIKKRIGYMSQKFSLYNDLTPRENLMFYAAVYSVPADQRAQTVDRLIDMAGLKDYQTQRTGQISGAWRQRLALACAIVHHPPMLFLDEPTAGVDPISRREFWNMVYEMAGEGVSVLATTHYMDEAEYCNTTGMMYQGKLIALASPDTLRDQLPGILLNIECDRPLDAETALDGTPGVLDASVHGVQLHALVRSLEDQPRVMERLTGRGIRVHRMDVSQPSLEDVFIYLIEQRRFEAAAGGKNALEE
ncbi:MAG: ABC transporter ATP-binding protein [Anaerolineaceae bacterium]